MHLMTTEICEEDDADRDQIIDNRGKLIHASPGRFLKHHLLSSYLSR